MSYVTPERVRAISIPDGGATPDLVDKATPASMSDASIQVAIDMAQSLVDAMLGAAYSTPFVPVPALVATLTAFEAAYLAELTLRKTKDLEKDDPFRLRHEWVMFILGKLATGEMVLPPDPEGDVAESSAAYNMYEGYMWLPQDFDMREVVPPNRFV